MALSIVTGANRGIGLSLTKLLRAQGASVLAVCRKRSDALDALGAEVLDGVDVTEDTGLARLRGAVGDRPVELLINNAGILVWNEHLDSIDPNAIRRQFEVNALGPLRVTAALQSNLQKGSKVALITSRMGSIDDNSSGGYYGYRMSKAALNMAGKSLANDLRGKGVAVCILHPGMVKTDMVGGGGQVEPDDAAGNVLARIDALTLETTGGFWHANGDRLPW